MNAHAEKLYRRVYTWLTWARVSQWMKFKLAEVASTIPLLGYALLWSHWLEETFARQNAALPPAWFDFTHRLMLLYVGATFLLVALVIYHARCPSCIKRTPDVEAFLFERHAGKDPFYIDKARRILRGQMVQIDKFTWKYAERGVSVPLRVEFQDSTLHHILQDGHVSNAPLFRAYFAHQSGVNPVSLTVCAAFYLVGAVLFLLPALETFARVVRLLVVGL